MKTDGPIKPVLLASTLAFVSACVGMPSAHEEPLALTGHALATRENAVWRPFSADSPWNTKLAADADVDGDSRQLIADLRDSSPWGPRVDVNLRQFSVPLYWADESTPKVPVRCRVGGSGFSGSNGMDAFAMVPVPHGAAPDAESDGHMLVVDRAARREWGLFRAEQTGDSGWTCGLGADMDLAGDGVRPIAQDNPTWYTSHGARACGFPLVAGLIRPEEVEAGRIEHALVIGYPHIQAGMYTQPASTAQPAVNEAIKSRGIPCGGRVQLDPELDLDDLHLSDASRVIARALQEYGAFVGDYSGAITLYADNSPQALTTWEALPVDDLHKLDLDALRVMELGTVYDNGNAD